MKNTLLFVTGAIDTYEVDHLSTEHLAGRSGGKRVKTTTNEIMSFFIFISAAAKRSGIKEADSEAAIKTWLRYAGDREGGRKRRAERQRGTNEIHHHHPPHTHTKKKKVLFSLLFT